MKEIALLTDRHTATCFKLAGLNNIVSVEDPKETDRKLTMLMEKDNIEIIIITDNLMNQIQIYDKIVEKQHPLIIPIPNLLVTKKQKTDLIAELIKKKTGIEVKF